MSDFENKLNTLLSNYKFKDSEEINNISKKFNQYFNFDYRKFSKEVIIIDEQLYRDFKRSDPKRYINLRKVNNPFGATKYSLGHFTKSYFIFKENELGPFIDGPFNNIEMDKMLKDKKVNSKTLIGINKLESFRLIDFINCTFPLPSKKNSIQTEEVKKIDHFNTSQNDSLDVKNNINSNLNKNKNEVYRKKKKPSQILSWSIKNKELSDKLSVLTNEISMKEKFNKSRSKSKSKSNNKKIKSDKNINIDTNQNYNYKKEEEDSNDFFNINEVPIEDEFSRNVTLEQKLNFENQKLLNKEINDNNDLGFEIN